MSGPDRGAVAALQLALRGEYAVVWGYDVVGARVGATGASAAAHAQAAHRTLAATTAAAIRAAGAAPADPAAAYDLPFAVTGRAGALRLAIHLEDGAAAAWRYVLASAASTQSRRLAADALSAAATRAAQWRFIAGAKPYTEAFPGS